MRTTGNAPRTNETANPPRGGDAKPPDSIQVPTDGRAELAGLPKRVTGMTRIVWLAGIAGLLAVALLVIFRGDAVASDDSAGCAPAESFVPAFCLNVPTSTVRRETTVPLVSLPSARADVLVETTVPAIDASGLAVGVDRAVERVETLFGHPFSVRPRVLVFGSAASFAQGARELFGYSRATAYNVAATYGGIFDRPTLTIALNWTASSRERMNAAIAHEVTHLMIRDITNGNTVPAWLDEGLATVIEEDTPGGAIFLGDEQLGGRALAASGATSLGDLDALADWHSAYAHFGRSLYAYAANSVRAMQARIRWDRMLAVLADVGNGTRFDAAYLAESGESTESLQLRVESQSGPAIAATAADATGSIRYTLFAGAANAGVEISIASASGYRLTFTVQTDGSGMYRGMFGTTAAPGVYTVSAAGASATFVTTR